VRKYLKQNGLIGDDVAVFHPGTRDRADLPVYRCRSSGVMFLDVEPDAPEARYVDKEIDNDGLTSKTQLGEAKISTVMLEDSTRRLEQFRTSIVDRDLCDFGAGHGLFLKYARPLARSVAGIELNRKQIADLEQEGIRVETSIGVFPPESFDVVTLFHVLEHLHRPIEILSSIKERMRPKGRLIVEVPHARDFLHQTLQSEAFKEFTFWSEHLVLHTRESLRGVIEKAGFRDVHVKGYQRYGLENHLHWLTHRKPGGHQHWAHLAEADLNRAYGALLQSLDQTDTLIATASA
jgi:2-polyprenyl-3-methyl-5-hydroxy-6-metoxy-1,4-benzoquinol methylase